MATQFVNAVRKLFLGIDLGTTFSLGCIRSDDGTYHFFSPPEEEVMMPSILFYDSDKKLLHVGKRAKEKANYLDQEKQVIRNIKRQMRENLEMKSNPYKRVSSNGERFTASEVASKYLIALKEAAEQALATPKYSKLLAEFDVDRTQPISIIHAVITVPAYFNTIEREATLEAAEKAGFTGIVKLLDEPVAAALAMEFHLDHKDRRVMVIDVGGGTTDITVLRLGKRASVDGILELGRIGNNRLGGIDFDEIVAAEIVQQGPRDEYTEEEWAEVVSPEDNQTAPMLLDESERAKIAICSDPSPDKVRAKWVNSHDPTKKRIFGARITRTWFDRAVQPKLRYIIQLCDALLNRVKKDDAGLNTFWTRLRRRWRGIKLGKKLGIDWSELDLVLLAGGGCLMPQLQQLIEERLGGKKRLCLAIRSRENDDDDAHEIQKAVAYGAAYYARLLGLGESLPDVGKDRAPCDIGYLRNGTNASGKEFEILIECNKRYDKIGAVSSGVIPVCNANNCSKINFEVAIQYVDLSRFGDTYRQESSVGIEYEFRRIETVKFRDLSTELPMVPLYYSVARKTDSTVITLSYLGQEKEVVIEDHELSRRLELNS